MVSQSHSIPAAYALPDVPPFATFDVTYVVAAPAEMTLPEFKASARAIVADAGLLPLPVSVQHELSTRDEVLYSVFAYETVFDTIAVYAAAATPELALADFSQKLGRWARRAGLLPVVQTMEGRQPNA